MSPGILRISAEYVQRVDISRPIGPFFARIWTGPPAKAHQAFGWLKNRIAVFEITDSDLGGIQTNDVPIWKREDWKRRGAVHAEFLFANFLCALRVSAF